MAKKRARKKVQENKYASLIPVFTVMAIVLLTLLFFRQMQSVTGYAVKESPKTVYCVKEGRDGLNHALYEKSQCCFLIANTDRCTAAMDHAFADYFDDGELEGTFKFHHACYGGSSGKVLVSNSVIRHCGLDI